MSLRWRLLAIFAVLGAIAIGAATWVAYLATSDELHDEVDAFLERRASDLVGGRRPLPGPGPGAGPEGRGGRPPGAPGAVDPDVVIQRLDTDGTVEASVGPTLPVDDADRAVAAGRADDHLHTADVDGVELRILTVGLSEGGAIQVARDLTEVNDVLAALSGKLVLITLAGAALAGLAGWLVAQRLTRPVRALAAAAAEVAATQDLTTPVPVEGHDEVGRLAESFNTMLAVLAESRQQQHQLVQDASHELRTPLTSLRASAELLERATDLDAAERDRLLGVIAAESRELGELVTELVELATEGRSEEPFRPVDLDAVVARAARLTEERTGRAVEVDAEAATVEGNEGLLERVVRNLLDNADKFSPAGTPITVGLTRGDTHTTLSVSDQGPGIPPEDRERVFDRFYRSPATRTWPGSGLGLAIVAQVVAAHGGRVWAGEAPGGGAALHVELPLSDAPTRR